MEQSVATNKQDPAFYQCRQCNKLLFNSSHLAAEVLENCLTSTKILPSIVKNTEKIYVSADHFMAVCVQCQCGAELGHKVFQTSVASLFDNYFIPEDRVIKVVPKNHLYRFQEEAHQL